MNRYKICAACEGTGYDWGYGNNPSKKPFKVPCNVCDAQGAILVADVIQLNKMPRAAHTPGALEAAARPVVLHADGRAAPHQSLPPRSTSLRGNLAIASPGGALSYDATNERWISKPSGMTPDVGAAAEPRYHLGETHRVLSTLTDPSPAASPHTAVGRFEEVVEVFTVVLGLAVFGFLAGFFLVLA